MNELNRLILMIQEQYNIINDKWINNDDYFPLNMKTTRVEDVYKNDTFLLYIFNYRKFLNDNIATVLYAIQQEKFSNIVNTRVKAQNSIQYKIQNYELNHENGKIALKKCLNDIFGIRMIFDDEINHDEIKAYIEKNFPTLKCIKSIRGDYIAVHIYFGNDDNKKFQWELQLWDKKHEKTNLDSHSKYKQEYTKWEQENF